MRKLPVVRPCLYAVAGSGQGAPQMSIRYGPSGEAGVYWPGSDGNLGRR